MSTPPYTAVVACNVLEDEVRAFAEGNPRITALVFMPQGLHNEPARLQSELQRAVADAEADPRTEAIALVYGLCSRGVENLRHSRCPIVIPRAHDCVTLLLGSKERYSDYLSRHPGTYWYSPGWIRAHTPPGPDREARLRREYAARFEPDEVEYLMEMEQQWISHYARAAYVGLGVGETDRDRAYTRHCADCLGWSYDQVEGDPSLLRALLSGDWDDDRFLVVPPGQVIRLTADERIMRAEAPDSSP